METESATLRPALHDFSVGDPIDSYLREAYSPACRCTVGLRILRVGAGEGKARGNFFPVGNEVLYGDARIREPRQNDLHLFLHVLATTLRAIPAVPTDPVRSVEPIHRSRSFVISGVCSPANESLILFGHRNPSNHKRPLTTQY